MVNKRRVRQSWVLLASASSLAVFAPAHAQETVSVPTSTSNPRTPVQSTPRLTTDSFSKPPASVRPKYRWWIPRGVVDREELRAEVREMAAAGAGGAEISPFFNPGGAYQTGQGLLDFGWESANWRMSRVAIYEEAARAGFLIDDTLSGLGSDAISVPHDGAMRAQTNSKRSVAGYQLIKREDIYDGTIPATPLPPLATALCSETAAGETSIRPILTHWLAPGDTITIGTGDTAEQATVATVGEGSWGCGNTLMASRAGDTMMFVSPLVGGGGMDASGTAYTQFNVGQRLRIGTGSHAETVEVRSLGEAAAAAPIPLLVAANAGSKQLRLTPSPSPFYPEPVRTGHFLSIGDGSTAEIVRVTAVEKKDDGLLVELANTLAHDHPISSVRDLGIGFTISPLTYGHSVGTAVGVDEAQPAGLTLAAPLRRNHALSEPVSSSYDQTLIAVTAMRCVSACDQDVKELDPESFVDLTAQARRGRITDLSWRTKGDWIVFVQRMASDEPFSKGAFSPKGFDFPVDHLSRAGADAVTQYWSQHVLTPAIKQALRANSAGMPAVFEDSLEMPFTQKWTADFMAEWRKRRGYDLTPFLPALFHTDQQARVPSGMFASFYPKDRFTLRGVDMERVREDYRQTWSDLFRERFVSQINGWAASQDLGTRFQLYGSFPIDTSWASSAVTIPEGEALGFDDDINTYSIVASGAHMSGNAVVSNECCAAQGKAYRENLAGKGGLLTQVIQAFAGGVNQQVWHGFNFSYTATSKWPGHHAWSPEAGTSSFSEAFGPRLPSWTGGSMRAVNDAIGRMSLVLRQGQPRYDVAVYHQAFGRGLFAGPEAPGITASGVLAKSGLTMEFISPEYLRATPSELFRDGVLFPDRSQYRALILDHQKSIAPEVADNLVTLAQQGMKLVVIGDFPGRATGYDRDGQRDAAVARASAALRTMAAEGKQVALATDQAAALAALAKMGVQPAAAKALPSSTVTVRRQDGDRTYYYLYNNSDNAVHDRWSLQGTGAPARLDPFGGTIRPVGSYSVGNGQVTLDVELPARGVAMIGLGVAAPLPDHVVEHDGGDVVVTANGKLALRGNGRQVSYRLAGGTAGTVALADAGAPRPLSNWKLTLTSWTPRNPGAVGKLAAETARTKVLTSKSVAAGSDGLLPSWASLTSPKVVGVGSYVADFQWRAGSDGAMHGAYLDLGAVSGSPSVTINGQEVNIDLQDYTKVDIGPYLKTGRNTVMVNVASNLGNAVYGDKPAALGLRGPVRLVPYQQTLLTTPLAR